MKMITNDGIVLFEKGMEEIIALRPLDLSMFVQLEHYLYVPVVVGKFVYENCKKIYQYADKQLAHDAWTLDNEGDERYMCVFIPVADGFFDFGHMLCFAFRSIPDEDQLIFFDKFLSDHVEYHINIVLNSNEINACNDRYNMIKH